MNTKGKGKDKGKREKAKSKAIIGIVLAAIMLASVFAVIMPAIAGNNTVNESVDDAPVKDANATAVVNESVEGEAVVASAVGSVIVRRDAESPYRNIANTSAPYVEILRLEFQPSGEAVNITKLVIKEEGTIKSDKGITGVGVSTDKDSLGTSTLFKGEFVNDEVTLSPNVAAYLGQLKDLYVWVNVTTKNASYKDGFALGETIILNLTGCEAKGLASGATITGIRGTPEPKSHTITGAGRLDITSGDYDIKPAGNYTLGDYNNTNTTQTFLDGVKLREEALIYAYIHNVTNTTAPWYFNASINYLNQSLVTNSKWLNISDADYPVNDSWHSLGVSARDVTNITNMSVALHNVSFYNFSVIATIPKTYTDAGKEEGIVIQQLNLSASLEDCVVQNVTLKWNGTADTTSIESIYLVNDSNSDGYLSYAAGDKRITELPATFDAAGYVTLKGLTGTTTERTIAKDAWKNWLVVVNTSEHFWSKETLAANITAINGTHDSRLISMYTAGDFLTTTNPLKSNITTGQAKITVAAGKSMPYIYVPADNNTNIELQHLNFTATAGEVNITHITLQLNATTDVNGNHTYPILWWDKDKNAEISPGDIKLNTTPPGLNRTTAPHTVTLDTNLTVGNRTYIEPGNVTECLIIAFNTTNGTTELNYGNTIGIEINNSWANYTAVDTNLSKSITGNATLPITTTLLTAKGAAPTVENVYVTKSTQPTANIGVNQSLIPVLGLKFNYTGFYNWEVDINSLTVYENGTANVTMADGVESVGLVEDTWNYGQVDANETLIAGTGRVGTDVFSNVNGSITLRPTTPIKLETPFGVTTGEKRLLVVINTTSDFDSQLNKEVWFNVSNPSIDFNSTSLGYSGGIVTYTNDSEATIVGRNLTVAGSIQASLGKSETGNVTTQINQTYLPLMQVKFYAEGENVNVTNITVTWNGTANCSSDNITVGVINDTNCNGVYDVGSDVILNSTATFDVTTKKALVELSPNLTIVNKTTACALIFVNTTAANLAAGETLAINISNPSTDYNATGITSSKKTTDYSTTTISSAIKMAKFTGLISTYPANLSVTKCVKGDHTNVALLVINFTAQNETVNISWIRVNATGTVNETNNITGVFLANDTAKNGAYDAGVDEVLNTTGLDFEADNQTIKLIPTTPIEVKGQEAGVDNSKWILVVASISEKFEPGENIKLRVADPDTDYAVEGVYSGTNITVDAPVGEVNNTVYITGESAASKGANTTATGALTVRQHTNVSLLQLNFSAKYESINITAINITELGTANGTANITNVGVVNDTDNDGKITDSDTLLNATATFNRDNGVANITLSPNLTIANNSYANMIIYVNTSSNFTFGQTLQVGLLNTSVNYTAYGIASGQLITDNSTAVDINSNVLTGTGNLTVATGANDTVAPDYINISTKTSDIVVWQLNLTSKYEKLTLKNLTLTENGTAHGVNDIDAVKLYYDANKNGTIDAGESAIASGTLTADNGTVTFSSLAQTIANNASKNYLVAVDINTTGFYDGDTLAFNLTNTSVNATGDNSSVPVYNNFTTISSNTTPAVTGVGTIELAAGANQPLTVTNETYQNYTSVLQLKFTAANGAINITNITVKENGTAVPTSDFLNISVIHDADSDGLYDTGETRYNVSAQITTDNGSVRIEVPTLYVNGTKNVLIAINTTTPTTGRTLVFEVNQTLGVGYNATGNVSLQTPYSTKNVTSPGTTISNPITIISGFPIELGNGWNLISTPLMPTNNATSAVVSDIASNLESVWAYRYNSTSGSMEWLVYTPGAGYDTLNYMDAGWGYWVNMKNADILVIDGTFFPTGEEVPPTYNVYTGWNLIGFHSLTNKNASVYLANLKDSSGTATWSTLYKYPHGGPYEQITADEQMTRGDGHWLSMRANGTIIP